MIAEEDSFDGSAIDSNPLLKKKQRISKLKISSPLIKRRVRALKNLITAQVEIELKFNAEVHLLKCKFQKEYEPFFNLRRDLIQGKYEPVKEEYGSSTDEDGGNELVPRHDKGRKMVREAKKETVPGIPNFWLTFTRNSLVHMHKGEIQPHDVPILSHLTDIRVNRSEKYIGYTMEFYFAPNEWFTNNVLVVTYEETYLHKIFHNIQYVLLPHKEKVIFVSTGCEIHWNEGKNVTETVKGPSFFKLFNTYENITLSNILGYFNHEYCEKMIANAVEYYLDPTINCYFSDDNEAEVSDSFEGTD
ncbi:nucleosome assembly protein 1-like 1-A [Myzus persicae]|uniref:nucleosome assembly protein 1-like 1-A n=1 Tax=Myzus persicae TaxID=13164 RepID=UPI000B930542|nr:nucleosome assembly protein 1-like 1-A [Myzus persicae]